MENKLLSSYLKYLNSEILDEQGRIAAWGAKQIAPLASKQAAKKFAVGTTKMTLKWTLLFTPALWAAWRTATALFSKAYVRCGTFSLGPGRKLCIIREKTKALRMKITVLEQARGQCSTKTSDSSACTQIINDEINKIRLKIDNLQTQYETLTGMALKESETLQELLPFVLTILGSIVVDKALFLAWRSVRSLFDSDLRKCGTYKNSEEYKVCIYTAKLRSLLQQYNLLKRAREQCINQKLPLKCRNKVDNHLNKLKLQVQRMRDNLLVSRKALADKKALEARP